MQGPYIGADGRVKHTRLIGEEIPEQPIEGTQMKYMYFIIVVRMHTAVTFSFLGGFAPTQAQ